MADRGAPDKRKRRYPPVYEKLVPVLLGSIVVAILVILVVIVLVAAGIFPGSG